MWSPGSGASFWFLNIFPAWVRSNILRPLDQKWDIWEFGLFFLLGLVFLVFFSALWLSVPVTFFLLSSECTEVGGLSPVRLFHYLQLQTSTFQFDIPVQWLFPVIPVANLELLKIGAGVRSPAQIHPSSTTETVAHGDFILNAAKRKALKWLCGEGMGNACEENTE